MTPLESLVATGTKVWLDSVDPDEIRRNRKLGATGATSNPIIIADLVKTGRFDNDLQSFFDKSDSDEEVAWMMTDKLVNEAQSIFHDVWKQTKGNDGWVSFELDPILEAVEQTKSVDERTEEYITLGKKWSEGHDNRMIKVPATPAGLAALEELVAVGICVNVTLIFSERQYKEARDACWRGIQRLGDKSKVKTVYSIFVSRLDVYTEKQVPELSKEAQGMVGIYNAKKIYALNKKFWSDKGLTLDQEMIFASTGTKKPEDPFQKYVAAFAGDDIETNPPKTNQQVAESDLTFEKNVDKMPPRNIVDEIEDKVDMEQLEDVLMKEGLAKFADPMKALIQLIGEKRSSLK